MDRAAAVAHLPEAYAAAIRLRDGGSDDDTIALTLGMARAAVPALLAIGERKLAALLDSDDGLAGEQRCEVPPS